MRATWYLAWAALTLLFAIAKAGGVTEWFGWLLAQVGHLFPALLSLGGASDDSTSPLAVAAAFADRSLASAILAQLIASLPLAMVTVAAFVRYRRFARSELGKIEGERFSNLRPVGVLDRARITRERRKIAAGHYMPNPPPQPTLDELRAMMGSATGAPPPATPTETVAAAPSAPALDIPAPAPSSADAFNTFPATNDSSAPSPAAVSQNPAMTTSLTTDLDPDDPFALPADDPRSIPAQHAIRKAGQ